MHQFPSSYTSRPSAAFRHRILSSLLVSALLCSMVATVAFGARPSVVGAQDMALSTASISPDSTLLYAALTLDTESDQFTLSQDLLERAGLLDLLDSAFEDAEASGDMDAADIEPFLGGEIAIVVTDLAIANTIAGTDTVSDATGDVLDATPEVGTPDVAGAAIVLRATDSDAALETVQELLADTADEDGATVGEVEYEGVTIEVAPNEESPVDGMAIAQIDDFIVISSTSADIEPFIDVSNGDADPLTEVEAFDDLQEELNDEFLLFAFIDGPTVKEAILADSDFEMLSGLAGQSLAAFDAYTGLVVWADDPGFRLDSLSMPSEDAEAYEGPGNYDVTLDEQVPADTLVFADGMDLGSNGGLDALALLIAQQINGEEPGTTPDDVDAEDYADEQFEEAEAELGFNLRTDFVEQFVGEYALAVTVPDIATLMAPDGLFAIFVSGVEDPSTLADSIDALTPFITEAVSETTTVDTRDIDGSEVTVISDDSSGFPIEAEYGVVDDQFLIGFGQSIDTFIEGPDDPLSDDAVYQDVMGLLPEEQSGVVYVNLAQAIALGQTLAGFASGSDTGSVEDASPDCAEYDSQEEAQAAYDDDPSLFDLDQDFDGEACEDYFSGGVSSPEAEAVQFQDLDLSAIQALGMVSFVQDDDIRGTSLIIYIEE
ncbi:MAG: DUF3352 domain-containing protein [Thermomicrobiales bacterium]